MRALNLSLLALSSVALLMVATPRPAAAQPGVLPANTQNVGDVEEVGYRYRGRYGYRPGIGGTDIIVRITDPTMATTVIADPTTVMGMAIGPTGVQVSVCGSASRPTNRPY